MKKDEIERRVARAAEILQFEPLLNRKPVELSGGQRQRVAIGRALVRDVDVFLFDEPLSNLDAKLRSDLRVEIKRLHQRLKNTMIYVTHDQIEALTLADRIAIMKNGVIQQLADPHTIYNKPVNLYVAGFIGSPSMNFLQGTLNGTTFTTDDGTAINVASYQFTTPATGATKAVLGVRPEHILLGDEAARMPFQAEVEIEIVEPMGSDTLAWGTAAAVTTSRRSRRSKSSRSRCTVSASGIPDRLAIRRAASPVFDGSQRCNRRLERDEMLSCLHFRGLRRPVGGMAAGNAPTASIRRRDDAAGRCALGAASPRRSFPIPMSAATKLRGALGRATPTGADRASSTISGAGDDGDWYLDIDGLDTVAEITLNGVAGAVRAQNCFRRYRPDVTAALLPAGDNTIAHPDPFGNAAGSRARRARQPFYVPYHAAQNSPIATRQHAAQARNAISAGTGTSRSRRSAFTARSRCSKLRQARIEHVHDPCRRHQRRRLASICRGDRDAVCAGARHRAAGDFRFAGRRATALDVGGRRRRDVRHRTSSRVEHPRSGGRRARGEQTLYPLAVAC